MKKNKNNDKKEEKENTKNKIPADKKPANK